MTNRVLFTILLTMLAAQSEGKAQSSCRDTWDDALAPTCESLELGAAHQRQLAAMEKANGLLWTAVNRPDRVDRDEVLNALKVAATTAALMERDDHAHPRGLPHFDDLAGLLAGMKRDLARNGWEDPHTVSQGFALLAGHLRLSTPQDRKRLLQVSSTLAGSLTAMYGPKIPFFVATRDAEARAAHRERVTQAREGAIKNSFYVERVYARLIGSKRFDKAPGLIAFAKSILWIAILIGAIGAARASRRGERTVMGRFLRVSSRVFLSGLATYGLCVFTGDLHAAGFLVWLVFYFLLASPIAALFFRSRAGTGAGHMDGDQVAWFRGWLRNPAKDLQKPSHPLLRSGDRLLPRP